MILTRRKFLGVAAGVASLVSLVPLGLNGLLNNEEEETVLLVQLEGQNEATTIVPRDFLLTEVQGPKGCSIRVKEKEGKVRTFSGTNILLKVRKGDNLTAHLKENPKELTTIHLIGRKL